MWAQAVARAARRPSVRAGLILLLVVALAAAFASVLAPYDPDLPLDPVGLRDHPPSSAHWLGTDQSSRDVLSRLLFGARLSLSIAVLAVGIAVVIGTTLGMIAGYFGGIVDSTIMRLVDTFMAIPRVLLLIAIVALWGRLDVPRLIVLLGCTGWFGLTRLVRAEVGSVRQRDFVLAARAIGTGHTRTILRHILPHTISPVLVAAALGVGNVILIEAGLSFLGIGVMPPTASWGNMIRDGAELPQTHWWVSVFPGLALAITVVAVNLVTDGLRQALSTRQLPAR
jgi:peptide/nickel transport system permease protein